MSTSTRVARNQATVYGKSSTASVASGKIKNVSARARDFVVTSANSAKLNNLWRIHN